MLKPGFCRQSQEKEPVGVREGRGIHRQELARERDPFNLFIKDWTHHDLGGIELEHKQHNEALRTEQDRPPPSKNGESLF